MTDRLVRPLLLESRFVAFAGVSRNVAPASAASSVVNCAAERGCGCPGIGQAWRPLDVYTSIRSTFMHGKRSGDIHLMKRCMWQVVLAVALIVPAMGMQASAEEAPASTVAGSVAVVNDYLFRGLSQTNWKPAVQPGIEYDHASGWYVGAWGSNISWLSDASSDTAPISSSVELDFYTGFRGKITGDWSYDVGLYEYYYPGTYPSGFTRPYTTEAYASIGFKGVTLKYSHAFTNLFGFAHSKNSGYVDLSYSYEFTPSWTVGAHVGHQKVQNVDGASYSDWRVSVSKAFNHGYSVSLGYYDTNASRSVYTNAYGHFVGRATGILTLSKSF
jgi:uncharacterized protein (TIGR02001 family)